MPTRRTVTVRTPIKVRPRPPEPPDIAVPPISTAAMLGSSRLSAIVGLPLAVRGTIAAPARPENKPLSAKTKVLTRPTKMPDNCAARGLAPIA